MKMSKTQLIGDCLYGYVPGEERVCIENSVEQISAFIMNHRFDGQVKITNYLDIIEVQTVGQFIDQCDNKRFLNDELLPILVPMQSGEVEVPEFVPYVDVSYSVKNVRVVNEEGKHLLINIDFFDSMEETLVNDEVYDTEEELIAKYPKSISEKLAEHIVNAIPYERDEFIDEYVYDYCDVENAKDLLNISNESLMELWGTEDEKLESFTGVVKQKIHNMTFGELLAYTFKHNMNIRSIN